MLTYAPVTTVIPVTDLQRSRDFYENTLGLTVIDIDDMHGSILFQAGGNTTLQLYKRELSKADHTLARFMVEDIKTTMDELMAKGLEFEKYNVPIAKTDNEGLSARGFEKKPTYVAWFKDPDGNTLAISQILKVV